MYGDRVEEFFPTVQGGSLETRQFVWMTTGTEDFLLESNRQFVAWIQERGIPVTYDETPGGHVWGVWRRALARLAGHVFR